MKINPEDCCPHCDNAWFQNMHNMDCFRLLYNSQSATDRLVSAAQNWLLSPDEANDIDSRTRNAVHQILVAAELKKPLAKP